VLVGREGAVVQTPEAMTDGQNSPPRAVVSTMGPHIGSLHRN